MRFSSSPSTSSPRGQPTTTSASTIFRTASEPTPANERSVNSKTWATPFKSHPNRQPREDENPLFMATNSSQELVFHGSEAEESAPGRGGYGFLASARNDNAKRRSE